MAINGDTATIIGSVIFMLVLTLAVVAAVLSQNFVDKQAKKKETRRRAYEALQRKAELRRRKEQEAADDALLDKIQEYQHDFDGYFGQS